MNPNSISTALPQPGTQHPITRSRIVMKDVGAAAQEYPEQFHPGEEDIASDEMRLTCIGSGNPVLRKSQAASSWLVELGNGDKFMFDCGSGAIANFNSLKINQGEMWRVFVTHWHLDHIGGLTALLDGHGFGRYKPLEIWGPDGATPELGTAHMTKSLRELANWHIESKRGITVTTGAEIIPHEFDATLDNQLVYDENGVKIYAYPVIHLLHGAVGYRLEWNGLSFSYAGDTMPSTYVAKNSENVDVFAHECFITADQFAEKMGFSPEVAENIINDAHTTPQMLGEVFSLARPKLGVPDHIFVNDDTIEPIYSELTSAYDGPIVIAQDLMVINVTPEQITTRMADYDPAPWPVQSKEEAPPLDSRSEHVTPDWVAATLITPTDKSRQEVA